ncbi:hypothetical protein KAT24_01665 [Candidatus Pacearchaeota archaeon]|nr:hypothetical protein [Candidatus Pacearchaeota archaeon]
MTYTITIANEDSIYMASDSRMNYFKDKEINRERYQEIMAIADGIQKTFFIENLNVGIQFIGVGFLPEGNKKYPISYFIEKLKNKEGSSAENNFKMIFNFFKDLSRAGNTGQYVKGVMSAVDLGKKKVCRFNTFNNSFEITELQKGNYLDSEGVNGNFGQDEASIIKEIERRINLKSQEKYWFIGGNITLLKITEDSFNFLMNFEEDFDNFNQIRWNVLNPPHLEPYETPDT